MAAMFLLTEANTLRKYVIIVYKIVMKRIDVFFLYWQKGNYYKTQLFLGAFCSIIIPGIVGVRIILNQMYVP